jgi:hypothetical protein
MLHCLDAAMQWHSGEIQIFHFHFQIVHFHFTGVGVEK